MTYATASDAARPSFVAGVSNADLAALVLRVSTGGLFLAHAGLKLFVFTPAGTAGFFESLGFSWFARVSRHCSRVAGGHRADPRRLDALGLAGAGAGPVRLDLRPAR